MACLPCGSSSNPIKCNLMDVTPIDNDPANAYDTFEKPIRVINCERTLESRRGIFFHKPKDWKFHVLSHTWSLKVREVSQEIGRMIGDYTDGDDDAYDLAFEKEDFPSKGGKVGECYKQLLEIFEILQADGVKLVWFDALCINQASSVEKSHEINNMGAYFSFTIGTYVLANGVDKLNNLCADVECVLPRWFTRVWTFQEFLLPRQLRFLVEGGVDKKFVTLVNCLIHEKRRNGLCKCFLNMDSNELDDIFIRHFEDEDLKWIGGFELRNATWKSFAQLIKERAPPTCATTNAIDDAQTWLHGPTHYGYQTMCCEGDNKTDKKYKRDIRRHGDQCEKHGKGEALLDTRSPDYGESITCSMEICKDCGSRPMICRAKYIIGREELTYLMDREVVLALMQCHSRLLEKGDWKKEPTKAIQDLRGLYCAWATDGNWKPCHAICEVGWRDCTNEEDRVLGILGLLGLRLKQLRTNKSLQQQVIELAKAGGSAMLVELCVMNQKGGPLPGMSWAPDFHGDNNKLEHCSRPRVVYVHIDRLELDGQLKVKVKMACGRVEPLETNPTKDKDKVSYRLLLHNSDYDDQGVAMESTSSEKFCFSLSRSKEEKFENSTKRILHFDFKQEEIGLVSGGAFEVPISRDHKLDGQVSFLVRLLLLGEEEAGGNLLLVCLPDKFSSHQPKPHEKLHKVGSVAIKDMPMPLQSAFESSNLHPCVIGAFGEELDEYIQFL